MVKDIPTSGAKIEEEETTLDKYPIADTTDFRNIWGLTPNENRKLEGVLNLQNLYYQNHIWGITVFSKFKHIIFKRR